MEGPYGHEAVMAISLKGSSAPFTPNKTKVGGSNLELVQK